MRLGSAFQKVNLRDLKDDNLLLNRNYFPSRSQIFDENAKELIEEIEEDLELLTKEL
jgi:phytoene/squalene synthetase